MTKWTTLIFFATQIVCPYYDHYIRITPYTHARKCYLLLNASIIYLYLQIPFPELINAVKTEKFMDATQVKLFEVLLGGFKPESCHSTLLDEIFYPRSITCQGL